MSTTDQPFDYAAEFGTSYHSARRLPARAEQWISSVRAEKLQKYVQPTDRVLEYGVGFGWNLAALKCSEKVGFDLTGELRPAVQAKGIRFEQAESELPTDYFDRVICHHVLEHVRQPRACLERLKGFLKKNGAVLLFVPFERERKFRRFRTGDKAHHLYSWTPESLRSLVLSAGWKVMSVRLQLFRFDRIAAVVVHRLNGGLGAYRMLRNLGRRALPEYEIALIATRI